MKSLILSISFVLFTLLNCKAYWQQHTATKINVTLDDNKHILRGFEEIQYTNNSKDTLKFLIFHIWPNAYKNDKTDFCEQQIKNGKKDFYFSSKEERGYIDSLNFFVDGQQVPWDSYQFKEDIIKIQLVKPLLPNQTIKIETPFKVKIPKIFSRLGHNKQAYFISQWFPKPAVYDQEGWHPIPYLDQGEFYSEYGSYDVSITLPQNYIIMATGNCQTPSEEQWIDSLSKLPLMHDSLLSNKFPVSSNILKTVRFTEDNVHDFAWFADKRWIIQKEKTLTTQHQKQVFIYTAALPEHAKKWQNAAHTLLKTVEYLSTTVGEYPYKTIKAIEGDMHAGGGMEYPTITIIDRNAVSDLKRVIAHEAGHNWFYGILGSNERSYPWMDEGLNSFYENRIIKYISDSTDKYSKINNGIESNLYFQQVATGNAQAASEASQHFTKINYLTDVYTKVPLYLSYLESYIGKENFEKGMKNYFQQWKFKHPQPNDFKTCIAHSSDKNLDWFFDTLMNSKYGIDFKISNVVLRNENIKVSIKNKKDEAYPTLVKVLYNDSIVAQHWTTPFVGSYTCNFDSITNFDKVVIDPLTTDNFIYNNQYVKKSLFKKHLYNLKVGMSTNHNFTRDSYVLPLLGYNVYDKLGLGVLFHNLTVPQNPLQYVLAPQFSFGSKHINGMASVSYSWFPKKTFQEIRIQTNVKTFSQKSSNLNISNALYARYLKISPFIELTFKESKPQSTIIKKLLIQPYYLSNQHFEYKQNLVIDTLYRPNINTEHQAFIKVNYQFKNNRSFHPFDYEVQALLGNSFIKLIAESNLRIDYDVPQKSLYIRGFIGKFISTNNNLNNDAYYLNTSYTGRNDILYDGIYIGRNENSGFAAKQISQTEGGFKIPTNLYMNPLGRSKNWLFALNLKTDLPLIKLPIRFFADFASAPNMNITNPSGAKLLYATGIELHLFQDAINVYLPLWLSTDFKDYQKSMYPKNKILNSLSFSLNFEKINFLKSQNFILQKITTIF